MAAHAPLHAGAERPGAAPYVPAGHGSGDVPPGQKWPTGHAKQSATVDALRALDVPAPQLVGTVELIGQ
jgi:hypothetical protein